MNLDDLFRPEAIDPETREDYEKCPRHVSKRAAAS